jgi:penicillin-binding protein 1A
MEGIAAESWRDGVRENWPWSLHGIDITFLPAGPIMANDPFTLSTTLRGERLSVSSESAPGARRRNRVAAKLALSAMTLTGMAGAAWLAWCLHDLPSVDAPKALAVRSSITVLAAGGEMLAEVGDLPGDALAADQLPPALVAAVLSTEDRRFFSHIGIDPFGIARAVIQNLRAGGVEQGGSTITQQLAKMLFLSPERTLKRKVQEMALAMALERRYSKQEILALYLNHAYFGAGASGIDAAARRYFDHPASELRVSEAAMLAGALKAPSRYNLVADREAAIARARVVVAAMADAGALSAGDATKVADELPQLTARPKAPTGGYFADWVVDHVRGMPETWGRSVTVTTTLDARLQKVAEGRVQAALAAAGAKDKVGQAAVVVMTPEGEVKAMVGGRNYADSPYNRAVQARRQPGSTFKAFVYLAAMEHGFSPSDAILDAPVRVGDWSPDNYLDKYRGQVTLRTAFADSLNSPAVRLASKVGIRAVSGAARRLGIESPMRKDATLALGSSEVGVMELTGAIATFASGGVRPDVHGIAEIRNGAGTVLYRHHADTDKPEVDASTITKMQDIMSEVVRVGTGKAAALDRPVAGKTGTSQDYRDAWFVGFTGNLVAGVWLGNDDNSPMNKVTGGSHAARLWREVMTPAHERVPPTALRAPDQWQLTARATPKSAGTADADSFLQRITGG